MSDLGLYYAISFMSVAFACGALLIIFWRGGK